MTIKNLLIANRGEIAVRIIRTAAELGIRTVAVHSEDEPQSRHARMADRAEPLRGRGASAFLDPNPLIDLALRTGCDALHPGYGFLSESAAFASACADAGLRFVGPQPEVLRLLGDKLEARRIATELGIPVLAGADVTSVADAERFFDTLVPPAAVMVKAVMGGGGRGMRVVVQRDALAAALERCRAEARAAFGNDRLYVEQVLPRARHIEVQVAGDGTGGVVHLWERECSLQRRNQKLVEVAPAPAFSEELRRRLLDAACRMAGRMSYRGLGTFEFLVDALPDGHERFYFLEANPRLQVEHTVTEEITGIDLVALQIRLADGQGLADLGLTQDRIAAPHGCAVQVRVNTETMDADGETRPASGTVGRFEPPGGPGVRVDTAGFTGYIANPRFDSLLAKVIVHEAQGDYGRALARARRALHEFRVDGVATNIPFLLRLLAQPEVQANRIHTRYVDEQLPHLIVDKPGRPVAPESAPDADVLPGALPVRSVIHGSVARLNVEKGDSVQAGRELVILEAMKMQYAVTAPASGMVREILVKEGELVAENQCLLYMEADEAQGEKVANPTKVDLDAIRPDLAAVQERYRLTADAARPDAVAKRHQTGHRTARENVADLCDPDSFLEYGALTHAAQRQRRPLDDLIRNTPADGMVTGLGTVNAELFGQAARCAVLAYDYTVLAGTQGLMNHRKTDRLLALVEEQRLPVVLFAEGGGGRPGDTDDSTKVALLDVPTFQSYARLSGRVPRIAVVAGRCFAGNAALAGLSDILIATRSTSIGMGGPAMIEGGGLGAYQPDEVGPVGVQEPNGVLDLVVEDEAAAVAAAKKALSYFQGPLSRWDCEDQRQLRWSIPEDRKRAYDIRALIRILADRDSVLELRPRFGPGMITAFIRIGGRPLGLIANAPTHMGGAIDAEGSDKAARFIQLCDAFDLPILSLCDTPGFLVGPQAEKSALVRHTSRLFTAAANAEVPYFTVVLRKGYGLGAMAMACGNFHQPFFTIAWPTGEFGAMGLEGAVRLAFRKELAAIGDEARRQEKFEELVRLAYERGKATSMAAALEIDAVIDPADTRRWILRGLESVPPAPARERKKRPMVDTW